MGQHHKALVCAVVAVALAADVAPAYEEIARRRLRKMGVVFLEDDGRDLERAATDVAKLHINGLLWLAGLRRREEHLYGDNFERTGAHRGLILAAPSE